MADKPIGALPTAENIADDDNFVLEQNSTAKRLTGKTLVSFLLNRLNGRGGIKSIVKVTSTGLVDLYDINYTDGTNQRITITNGRGITGIDKVSTNGNADTYAIRYNDGTSTQFTVLNGTNGKDGEDAYVWVRYASLQPSNANPSFGEVPDRWMGVYSGPDATAPKEWSAYKWYDTKGERGLSIYRVNGINRPLYRYSYNDLIMPVDHTPKVGDLVITTDGYLASVTQVFADTEQVDVESTDIRLGGESYVELLYGDDGLTVFDAVNSGRPVYLLYEDYRLPMVTWTTDVLSATFGGCFDDKIITCKFEGAVWSANVKTIEGATDETGEDNVVIVTESTTQAELSAAYNAGKVIVLKRYQAGGYKLYYHAGNWRFFRVADGVIEEAVYNAGTWTYSTVESGTGGDIFVGDADTTVAEYNAAFASDKACFMIRPYGGTGNTMWTAYTCNQSNAQFYRVTGNGEIQYGMLNSDGTFNYTTLGRTTTINEKSTDDQIPTAKAVYDAVKDKLDSTALPEAVNDALAQAKASGEFDGKDGLDATPVTPLFANSIEECTDTTKLYVLPDGYIYAYILTKVTSESGENILPSLAPLSGITENERGLYYGYYPSTSSPFYVADPNCTITGMIPYTVGNHPVLYIKGVKWDASSSHSRLLLMKHEGTAAQASYNLSAMSKYFTVTELDTNYYKLEVADETSVFYANGTPIGISHMVLGFDNTSGTEDIVISYDPIESTVIDGYQWANTGHAFVPADYEDRIIDLESRVTSLGEKVDELSVGENGAPLYISTEAERVANLVQDKRTVGSITFTAMSDPHVFVGTDVSWLKPNETSVRDAGLALSEFRKHITLDFVAMLGDITYGAPDCTIEQLKNDIQYFRKCMADGTKGIPNLWLTGNHDINYGAESDRRMTEDELYAYITSNNVGTIQDGDNIGRNYGYIDFDNQKIRCVYLNSVDALDYPDNIGTADDALEITAIQTQWLANTGLDLSEKKAPEEWQILLFSHHPLNLYSHVMTVLEAYRDGTAGNAEVITNGAVTAAEYDFTQASRGEIIANIHGHNHNFTAKKIGTSEEWLWRICVPNMDVTRNNEAATSADADWAKKFGEFDAEGNPVYYPKTQSTATSTSFCVFTIDRKNRKIHAICYGAGIDREISY